MIFKTIFILDFKYSLVDDTYTLLMITSYTLDVMFSFCFLICFSNQPYSLPSSPFLSFKTSPGHFLPLSITVAICIWQFLCSYIMDHNIPIFWLVISLRLVEILGMASNGSLIGGLQSLVLNRCTIWSVGQSEWSELCIKYLWPNTSSYRSYCNPWMKIFCLSSVTLKGALVKLSLHFKFYLCEVESRLLRLSLDL